MLIPTLRAFPFDDERNGVGEEAFGQLETRNMNVFHTERTLAGFTIKMNVAIVMITCAFLFTYLIIQDAASVLESMNHIMLQEKRKHTEDARLVHRHHSPFQHAEALGMRVALQGFHHQYAVGCRFDTLCLQFSDNIFCFHLIIYMYLLLFYLSRCKDTKYNKIFALFYYKYLLFFFLMFSILCFLKYLCTSERRIRIYKRDNNESENF